MNLKIKRFLTTIGKCAFVAAALLCSCDKDTPDNPNDKDEPEKPVVESDVLNIMSFNMRYPATEDTGDKGWDVRKQACVSLINSYKPDVIAAQELRTAQRTYLKEQLTDYAFIEIPNTGTASGGNIVMLYRKERFTKLESGHFFLSFTPDQASKCFNVADSQMRGTVWAKFKENGTGKEFVCMGTHLPVRTNTSYDNAPYIEARVLSARLLMQQLRIKAGNDGMCFLMGDMNCSWKDASGNDSDDGRQVLNLMNDWMTDARSGKNLTPAGITSFNSFGTGSNTPNRNIDHIFFRNAEQIDFNTITKSFDNIRFASDHYPILLRVKL